MEDKELFNPQTGEKIAPKKPKKFYKDWKFYVYSLIALLLALVSVSSMVTACAAINAGVGADNEDASSFVAPKGLRHDGADTSLYGTSSYCIYNYSGVRFDMEVYRSLDRLDYELDSDIGAVYSAGSHIVAFGITFSQSLCNGWYDIWADGSLYNSVYVTAGFYKSVNLVGENNVQSPLSSYSYFWIFEHTPSDDDYDDGYADGYAAGESAGYSSGYSEGLEVGNSNGEANGYANGYAAGLNASNYFKSITANSDLVFFDILANITPYYTDGDGNLYYYRIFSADVGEDSYYCWLCYYSTSNWSQWDVYLVWCDQSSSSGFTLDYLTNHSLGVWGVPKSNGAFSAVQSYAVYQPTIKTLDNAKVSLVYNVQMMQAYVTLDGGRTYGDVYKDGYNTGYENGYNYGYELGETAGINAAEPEALTNTLVAVFQQPFNQIYRFFNFNILGLNVLGLATGLLSVFIIIKVFKKVLK